MEAPKLTTAGSLLEQTANAEMRIAAARRARGSGNEAVAIGGRKLESWSPRSEAVFRIVEIAFDAALDPGKPEMVDKAAEFLGRRAVGTREALRDAEVQPLRQQTTDAMRKHIARAVAGLEVRNAKATCQTIVDNMFAEIEHLQSRVEAAITHCWSPSRLLEGIDEATRAADAGLATVASALHRLRGQAATEPARIAEDLAAAEEAVREAQEHLRVVARERRPRFFGVDRAISELTREVHVTVPKMTDERIALAYLPIVSRLLPDVGRSLTDRAERSEKRIETVRQVRERLRSMQAEEVARLSGRGRVQIVGAPDTAASHAAAVDDAVNAVYPSIARELRDVITWQGPLDRLLEELLMLVRERVAVHVPLPSIDDVLLHDADPQKVAVMVDHLIRDSDVPVALESGADRSCFRELRCRVIRVPAGSKVAQAMITHAGYRSDSFDWTGPADSIEIIVWQPGISLRDTRLFRGGEMAYREERNDPAAPPVETLADDVLRSLRRPRTAPPVRPRRRRYGLRSVPVGSEGEGRSQDG